MAYPSEIDAIADTPSGSATLGGSTPPHDTHHTQLVAALRSLRTLWGGTFPIAVVEHGASTSVARPDAVWVVWIGTAVPSNAVTNDLHIGGA